MSTGEGKDRQSSQGQKPGSPKPEPGNDPAQSAETVNLAYTVQGLPGRLYSSGDYVQSGNAVYDVAGRLTQLKLGKQSGNSNPVVQVGFSYYPWTTITGRGRLQQLTAGIPGNLSSLQNLTYAYDAVGNVDWIKD